MYGVTSGRRPVYRCGQYMRTAGSECPQNTTDGETLLGFVLDCWERRRLVLADAKGFAVALEALGLSSMMAVRSRIRPRTLYETRWSNYSGS